MKNLFKTMGLGLTLISVILSGCGREVSNAATEAASPDRADPVIQFEAQKTAADGTAEYYLFDDNPEHLNSKFLADGEEPSSIAHFGELQPGIYTVFSYHHRGYSVDLNADLYYDAVFSSSNEGEFEILNLGIDHDWDWNQAWADYTGTEVVMPEFLRTFNCTCGEDCPCINGGDCPDPSCPAIIRNESRQPKTAEFDNLNTPKRVSAGSPLYLSEVVSYIEKNDVNHFRYGGWNEPMWMMLRFRVTGGSVNFDTVAYQDQAALKANFSTLKPGAFDNEPQYKGIAPNAPIVTAEFEYTIDDATPEGPVPVTVINARAPQGVTIPDGVFATNVNTWREEAPIAAESDIMRLEYKDDTKYGLYGSNVAESEKDNVWRFDPYHTKHYGGYDKAAEKALREYGVAVGENFIPNSSILDINYPKGSEISTDEFYAYNACNLGNFGVTSRYIVHLKNSGTAQRTFSFSMESIAGQVYRYSQIDAQSGEIIADDGGKYIMKKFDDDPREDPASTSDPKERLTPARMGDTLSFETEPGKEYAITIEITTLTGCVAPLRNKFEIK